jgi:putative FmdB family regulatory protein
MPLYEFVCNDCHKEQEQLVRPDETPTCEACGGQRMARLLSTPVAHISGQSTPRPQGGGSCGSGCGCHPH